MKVGTGTRLDLLREEIILQLGRKLQVEKKKRKQGHMLKRKCAFAGSQVSVINLCSLVLHHSHLFSALIS